MRDKSYATMGRSGPPRAGQTFEERDVATGVVLRTGLVFEVSHPREGYDQLVTVKWFGGDVSKMTLHTFETEGFHLLEDCPAD